MLVLTRRPSERIYIQTADGEVWIELLGITRDSARLGITAPRQCAVERQEVRERKEAAERAARKEDPS